MAFLPYFLLIIFLIMQEFEQKSSELDVRFVFIQVKRFDVWVAFHGAQFWISRHATLRVEMTQIKILICISKMFKFKSYGQGRWGLGLASPLSSCHRAQSATSGKRSEPRWTRLTGNLRIPFFFDSKKGQYYAIKKQGWISPVFLWWFFSFWFCFNDCFDFFNIFFDVFNNIEMIW